MLSRSDHLTPELEEAAQALGGDARLDVELGARTTYRVGGRAALLVEIDSEAGLERLHNALERSGAALLVLGRGSNLLVADEGFHGICAVLGSTYGRIAREGEIVTAGGALALPILARKMAASGLSGLEWGVGVPGSVGGAVRMNAGGHGSETARTLIAARLFNARSARDEIIPADRLGLGYRSSSVGADDFVLEASFGLKAAPPRSCATSLGEIVSWRRSHQPGGQNAGSVFKNPSGDSAGRLVEVAGCKGLRVGSASVSDKHANFVQADPHGRASDVRELIEVVRRRVLDVTGVALETELKLVGFNDD
jgi:UDP-N-acetylmuramate dehydrogenase